MSIAYWSASRSSLAERIFFTSPLTAFGMWSTYCGLMIALMSSSRIFVK